MPVGANSYGTAADVAALCRVYTNNGAFDTTTVPTLANVEGFIDQTSALVNTALAAQGFTVPIVQADAVLACKSMVVQICSDLAHASNSAGRFFSERALTGGLSIMATIRKDIADWVADNASGFTELGAARRVDSQNTIAVNDSDYPFLFTRDQFGSDRP